MGWCQKSDERQRRKTLTALFSLAFFAVAVHAQLGTPPIILVQPLDASVQKGDTALITATVAPSITPQHFYWYLNGQPVASGANVVVSNAAQVDLSIASTLVIFNANAATAGTYSLRITNGVGSVISSNAVLVVSPPTFPTVINILQSGTGMTVNGFKLLLSGPSGSNFVIEASTNLKNWSPIFTNVAPAGSLSYTDTSATSFRVRYYRARTQ